MSSLINLHTYWMLNVAIALSYFLTFCIFKLAKLSKKLSQGQLLHALRQIFIFTLLIFTLTPVVITKLSLQQNNALQLQPLLQHASAHFFQKHVVLNSQVEALKSASPVPNVNILIIVMIGSGLIFLLIKYIKEMLVLINLTNTAFCQRKIKNIHILFSDKTTMPFCWSAINSHYVIIPNSFLEKGNDLKLILQHEFQHIRQGDTYWLHVIAIIKLFCFWNPFMKLWNHWFGELQELACDETLILHKKTSRISYAQCLIDAASDSVKPGMLGILGLSKNYQSLLKRRVTMLFAYKNIQRKKFPLICTYAACFLTAVSCTYALENDATIPDKEFNTLAKKSALQVIVTPEAITELNNIRSNEQARSYMIASLERMKQYKPYIETQLENNGMPSNLLALPLLESGYNVKAKSPMQATGIWQFIPSTAKQFDLVINSQRDDRLDTKLATKAALSYLKALYSQFQDWKLAVIAYEIGETNTEKLINTIGSRDPWVLARAPEAPKDLKKFLAMFDACVMIMNNPELVGKKSY